MTLSISYRCDEAIKEIQQAKELGVALENENLKLKRPFGVLEDYEPLVTPNRYYDCSTAEGWNRYQQDYAADVETAKRNGERFKRNMALHELLEEMIQKAGFRTTDRIQKRSKVVEEMAAWKRELYKAVPRERTTLQQLESTFANNKRRFEEAEKSRADAQRKQEAEMAAQERERQRLIRIVEVSKELGLDPATQDIDLLIQELRGRDKYLDLAIAGMDTRGDWSDGAYRVEDALGRFQCETENDTQIVSEWSDLCSDFEDGRCFRDATWNYDVVMELADKQIAGMYEKLCEFRIY